MQAPGQFVAVGEGVGADRLQPVGQQQVAREGAAMLERGVADRDDRCGNMDRRDAAAVEGVAGDGLQIERQDDRLDFTALEAAGRDGRIVDLGQIDRLQCAHGAHEVVVERVEFAGQLQADQMLLLVGGDAVLQRAGRSDVDRLVARDLLGEQDALRDQAARIFQVDGRVAVGRVGVGQGGEGERLGVRRRVRVGDRQPRAIGLGDLDRVGDVGLHPDLHGLALCGDLHGVGRNDDDALDEVEDTHDGGRSPRYEDQHPVRGEVGRGRRDDDLARAVVRRLDRRPVEVLRYDIDERRLVGADDRIADLVGLVRQDIDLLRIAERNIQLGD